jgi:hypothetical protein
LGRADNAKSHGSDADTDLTPDDLGASIYHVLDVDHPKAKYT